ncbi:alkyl/aryl-sulfatase [Marinactinospora thermotolerans]|uniref:Linear primary-alkylsulfatase n=1 Tax=Marinactinospora thermotolerans DSM 45154 TaxID=1122192 RepID=A0A1T4R9M2_9ACTN|nr:alkyl sulfatase dimerization domain-containing protein [Marinactinospora thermotolerans]SKA12653.1 Alkyl sulfatase BDS1, metallo-beta-lactamase superfamily [Marinactinospora thermotolerans DSM 45154]
MDRPSAPTERIAAANRAAAESAPDGFDDDLAAARRGFVAGPARRRIEDAAGRVVWDFDRYRFLDGRRPDSVHPGLWEQARLLAEAGLFEVVPGVYQVRGFDLSNMTLVEGERGVIVIDPLISVETSRAALDLYRRHRGDRPVTAVVFTHNHVDHFGGVLGLADAERFASGEIEVLAPEGFTEHAVSENVHAGTVMSRRAVFMYGSALEPGPRGQVGVGLGLATSTGRVSLVRPTVHVERTGQEHTVDGVRMVFQLAADTEAPAELNFFLPDLAVLCVAETATHTQHNLGTLRGAPVRDARAWARSLTETVVLFGDRAEVLIAGHHWPTWGAEAVVRFLCEQRDLYAYLHDQTLRLMNRGLTAPDIAENLALPPRLERARHARGYYGSTSHNVKAIYQRYIGWFDGNPAHLWPHPPVAAAQRYVRFMGGADRVVDMAWESYAAGDYRWVVEVVDHVVQAEPDHARARELQAAALEQLGYGAENATWRNFYLTAALELRTGRPHAPRRSAGGDLLAALEPRQLFEALAVRLDGPRAAGHTLHILWRLRDDAEYHTVLSNGVLVHDAANPLPGSRPGLTLVLDRAMLNRIVAHPASLPELIAAGEVGHEGDLHLLATLFGLVDKARRDFPVVTPATRPADVGESGEETAAR